MSVKQRFNNSLAKHLDSSDRPTKQYPSITRGANHYDPIYEGGGGLKLKLFQCYQWTLLTLTSLQI